jgi:hypothetical protein
MKSQILEIIRRTKNILHFNAFAIAFESNKMFREAKEHRLGQISEAYRKLEVELTSKQKTIITNENIKNKMLSLSANSQEKVGNLQHNSKILEGLIERLKSGNLSDTRKITHNGSA